MRTTESVPEDMSKYKFDVEIINGGKDDSIVIGLSCDTSDKSPGMNANTIGIYGSDGRIYRDGEEASLALPFTTGDLISCEIYRTKIPNTDFTITSCKFLKNLDLIGSPLNIGGKKHHPEVRLHSPDAEVRIQTQFRSKMQ